MRLDIRRIGSIKKGDEVVGNETRVKVVKNKVAPPFKQAEFDIMYGAGISREGEIIDLGVAANVVDKSGAWYSYNGNRIGQGKDNVREYLKEHRELAIEIETACARTRAWSAAPPSSCPRPKTPAKTERPRCAGLARAAPGVYGSRATAGSWFGNLPLSFSCLHFMP